LLFAAALVRVNASSASTIVYLCIDWSVLQAAVRRAETVRLRIVGRKRRLVWTAEPLCDHCDVCTGN